VRSTVSLADATATGDRRSALVAVRDHLADVLMTCEAGATAQLVKQLRETLAELETLDVAKEVSASDDLAAKRKARRAATKAAAPSQRRLREQRA
jgi:hypothetical protein